MKENGSDRNGEQGHRETKIEEGRVKMEVRVGGMGIKPMMTEK